MNYQVHNQVRVCEACGIHAVRGPRSIRCESCHIALQKANNLLAAYRHRQRKAAGEARKNRTYRGKPTEHIIREAIKILMEKGVFA